MAEPVNIARHLPLVAAAEPNRVAIKIPRGRTPEGEIDYLALTFAELEAETNAWTSLLRGRGVARGDRVLVMVRQGLPLIASTFALFKLGAVPVIIDPGMGRKNFLACVARSKPRVLLGIPLAQWFSHIFRGSFRSVERRVWVSGAMTARCPHAATASNELAGTREDELAAILFTSGSTGAPKGVCYTHGMFEAQVRCVRDTFAVAPGEIDLPLLPIFALFNPALGMTTIVPEIDPTKPATVDAAKIVQAIQQEKVTNSFGSPTLWRKIAAHARATNRTLPSLRRVLMAGAPVPPSLFAEMKGVLPEGEALSPYGATEALPIAFIRGSEVLDDTAAHTSRGAGTCVGRPVKGVEIAIIAISDEPLPAMRDAPRLARGQIGEIVVRGPMVTREYDGLTDATRAAKMVAEDGTSWHRMGDVGYLDEKGRLWFCGRKAERVETPHGPVYTEQVEPIFNAHPGVRRTALIGMGERGRQRAALVVEPASADLVASASARRKLVRELRALGEQSPVTDQVRLFYLHPSFPVDVRHNAKIHRLQLAAWAAGRAGYVSDRREIPTEALRR